MSMTAPPNHQPPPPLPQPAPLTLKQRLAREAWHWADLPPLRFAGLLLPIGVFVFIAPPLPVVAYALWLWASSSGAWRERWASIWALARRGGVFVSVVLLFAVLSSAHVWFVPDLAAALQAFWRAHLPGELSLMPLFEPSLLARTLLLLPLAPLLAVSYERIDPRTRVEEQRVLTARDMQPKQPKQDAAPQEPKARAKPKPKPKQDAAPREKAEQQHSESPAAPAEQITIEGFLASDTDQAQARPASPTRPPAKKQQAETPAPAPSTQIDWSDVAE